MIESLGSSRGIRHGVVIACLLQLPVSARADSATAAVALQTVRQFSGQWTSPPKVLTGGETTDAPLLGNGNVGVAVTGGIGSTTFLLDKNEFWSLAQASKWTMANMNLAVSGMDGASYEMREVLADAQVTGSFSANGNTVRTSSWVQATDATNNLFVTRISYSGTGSRTATISFSAGTGNSFPSGQGTSGNVIYIDVSGDGTGTVGGYATCQVRCAATVIGAAPEISGNHLTFTMQPGNAYTVVSCIMSNYDSPSWKNMAVSNIGSLTASDIAADESAHKSWWGSFWGMSYVLLPDPLIEREYYGSLYLLACCSRAGHAPPGLWGNWTLPNSSSNGASAWGGDYHLNYNHEVTFLFALTVNHPELLASYGTPILDWMPKGRATAAASGYSGLFYPAGIGPLPNGSVGTSVYGNQKTDAAYAAVDMIACFYATRDNAYAKAIYPYLKGAAAFWQDYLRWNGSTYDILSDSQQEDDPDPQTNGMMSLGLVHYLLQGCVAVSAVLDADPALRSRWSAIERQLAPYPTFTYNGQTVFRETSVGRAWCETNDVECQMIYPANQVGLLSPPGLLGTAYNTVNQMNRWTDGNATPSFYPAAARVGYPASAILGNLHSWVAGRAYNNMAIPTAGGGIECCNTVPACITEMMMQSFQGVVLLFPDWPSGGDGRFGDLLANGDFLVSSAIKNGAVRYVRAISQAGGAFTFRNPWPGRTLALYRNGKPDGTLSGTDITVPTAEKDVLLVAVYGSGYDAVVAEMQALPNLP